MSPRPVLDNPAARRLFLHRHGLGAGQSGPGRGEDLAGVIRDLGFVQVDSVNTLARAHDLILWTRRQQYRPEALGRLSLGERQVFEHWTHDAAVIPVEFFAHWRHRFDRDRSHLAARWREWRRDGFVDRIEDVLRHVQAEGECRSSDVGADEERKSGGWWDWHPSKTALEYLWRVGELSVVRRDGFQKVYDLTERVIPERHRAAVTDLDQTIDWACNAALDRLGFATPGELADFWALVSRDEARDWCARALADGRLIEADIEAADGTRRPTLIRPQVLAETVADLPGRVRILSPFDPALRDRKRAERLLGFRYRIEIFVPAARRQYGYYVFPVMEGDRMIGRIDLKADRAAGAVDVTAFWPEPGVAMGKGRIQRLGAELERMARFAGCEDLRLAPGWLRETQESRA